MIGRVARLLLAVWVGVCTVNASAQVDWIATLNLPPAETQVGGPNFALTSDGAIVSAGMVATGEATRVRIARVTSSGAVQWVRWATGGSVATPTPVWAHPDNSTTVAYQDPISNYWCFENFSATGDSRFRSCPSYAYVYNNDLRIALAADGDFYIGVSSYPRVIRKISPLGVYRWTRTESTNSPSVPTVHGVDSAGNYFEAAGTRLVTWSGADGAKLSDVILAGTGVIVNASNALARTNLDVVTIRAQAATNNAMTATVTRNSAVNGSVVWSRDLIFPGYGPGDKVRLVAADGDATYIIRTAAVDGDSHVAKISAAGTLLWQKHYARVRRIVDYGTTLTAIRTDVSTATNANDSFLFPIASADGTLGSPMIYTRPDLFAPTDWFATATGVLATYQGSNPFAPFAAFPVTLAAAAIYIDSTSSSNRWQLVATVQPPVSTSQGDCLMPKLSRSSPSSWWARVQTGAQSGMPAAWIKRDAATGVSQGQTVPSAPGCGSPVTADGGQVVVSGNQTDRIKRFDVSGSLLWQTQGVLSASYYGFSPLVSIAASGDVTYVAGSVIGRVSTSGSLAFEAETNRSNPRYLAVDSTNSVWLVSGSSFGDGYVSRVSATGALLWSVAIDVPACTDVVMSARLMATDEMLVTTQSCSEGRVFKLNGAGQIVWQRVISGTSQRPSVTLAALHADAAGNVYAGGCLSNSSNGANPGSNAFSIVASWTAGGVERWTAITDLIAGASECVGSIVTDTSGNIFVSSSSSDVSRFPVLWSLDGSGAERWRHQGLLANPSAASTELTVDDGGKILALGEAAPGPLGNREASLRRINPASVGSALRLKVLQVPSPSASYATPFTVRVGLRTAADASAVAAIDTTISLGVLTGTGSLGGTRSCTIIVGNSECSVVGATYDVVESGVVLLASSDGFAAATSSAFSVAAAATITTLTELPPGPHAAFTMVRVQAAVLGPTPSVNQNPGYVSQPYWSGFSGYNCTADSPAGVFPSSSCNFIARVSSSPITSSFSPNGNTYQASSAPPLSLVVTPVTPTLQVTLDPLNTFVTGDKVRLRVSLIAPNGFNASQFVPSNTIVIPGGYCGSPQVAGSIDSMFLGSYWNCELGSAVAGSQTINVSFSGSTDLLPAGPVGLTFTANAGAVVRSSYYVAGGPTVCSTAPGVTCNTFPGGSGWQCSGPVGADIDVFFLPPNGSSFVYPNTPLLFKNATGVQDYTSTVNGTYTYSSCTFDVDGDGARLAATDGILILRRMLGLTGGALTTGATHTCVPRSALGVSNAINLPSYDIDGDGQTLPATDGLILLRALLGFRGDALTTDAISATATRRTYTDIRDYLSGWCSFSIN